MSVELMTENFLQMTQSKSCRCEETFSVHGVNKNKPTSGHWVFETWHNIKYAEKAFKGTREKRQTPDRGKVEMPGPREWTPE